MEKYLILDGKWSSHYGRDIYWKCNSDGYTELISDAGIYEKKDMKCKNVKYILITREVLDNALEQLKEIDRDIKKERISADERHEKEIKYLEECKKTNYDKFDFLINLSQELGL